MKVIILRGASGAGKSTWINQNYPLATKRAIVSADHYFTSPDGSYNFDASKLGEAHGACLREFLACVRALDQTIIVDNTNVAVEDMAPYIALAEAYGYEVQIVQIDVDPVVAARRNKHGVPLAVIERHVRALREPLPRRWWPYLTLNRRAA